MGEHDKAVSSYRGLLARHRDSYLFAELAELSSDNTDHISGNWTTASLTQDQASLWQDVTDTDNDSPYALWNSSYSAIAAANAVLQGIEKLGNPQDMQSQRGEALLCRAYNHFVLVNIFCRAYSPKTSDKDLGIPYMTDLETSVLPSYSRGTVREVYEKIEQDLLQGLSLVSDEGSKVPKYHFNRKSALAFAARFYLYYVQPDKSNYRHVIDYATDTTRPCEQKLLSYFGETRRENNRQANTFPGGPRQHPVYGEVKAAVEALVARLGDGEWHAVEALCGAEAPEGAAEALQWLVDNEEVAVRDGMVRLL
jgi:hypothetical protein